MNTFESHTEKWFVDIVLLLWWSFFFFPLLVFCFFKVVMSWIIIEDYKEVYLNPTWT